MPILPRRRRSGQNQSYVGKKCVKYNVPSNEALDRLIDLIKEHDKWVEPI